MICQPRGTHQKIDFPVPFCMSIHTMPMLRTRCQYSANASKYMFLPSSAIYVLHSCYVLVVRAPRLEFESAQATPETHKPHMRIFWYKIARNLGLACL